MGLEQETTHRVRREKTLSIKTLRPRAYFFDQPVGLNLISLQIHCNSKTNGLWYSFPLPLTGTKKFFHPVLGIFFAPGQQPVIGTRQSVRINSRAGNLGSLALSRVVETQLKKANISSKINNLEKYFLPGPCDVKLKRKNVAFYSGRDAKPAVVCPAVTCRIPRGRLF